MEVLRGSLAIDGGAPVRDRMLVFGAPVLDSAEAAEVLDTLQSGWIGTGPKTAAFEAEFAAYVGARHAVAVNSCTAALHLSLVVSGVGPGDEVITSPLTFCATANVAVHQGAVPRFADVDPITLNIDPAAAEAAITPRTRALLPVHFGGLPCAMTAIGGLAAARGLTLVEDAAHAVGARHDGGAMVGGLGHLTCFSFYANKNLTTAEGGMVTCDDDEVADALRVWRLHGLSRDAWKRYQSRALVLSDALQPGYKYNMTDLQASIGIHQLRKQEGFLEIRERLALRYDEAFDRIEGVRRQPRPAGGARHALHLYVLILDPACFRADRDEIVMALRAENIGAAIHYRALHTHPYYRDRFGYVPGDFPVAEAIGRQILSLPLTPGMTEADADDVVEAVTKVLRGVRR
ncbi:MAG: DegT/DnrJ/EryC1/StrS family aminotransferase [Vicinamibacterales bacterium]